MKKHLTVEEAEAKAKAWFQKKKPAIQAHDPRRWRAMSVEEQSIAIQSYAAGLRQEGEEPKDIQDYTVVVKYRNPDDYRDTNNYTLVVQSTSADMAGAVAVDSLINEIHEPDNDDQMDPDKWMDSLRADYTCIAIFQGQHENQVK